MEKKRLATREVEDKKLIQAVIITDTFNDNFYPITASYPPCLMKLVNRTLLDYTLECLSTAGVQETILFCSSHADKIKEFVGNGSWGDMNIVVVVSEGCRSFGDAMRDLDAKALIRSDFILLSGNVVGSIDILPILEQHKKIQKIDKGAAMTLIFKECGKKIRHPQDMVYVAIDNSNNRLLHHEKLKRNRNSKLIIPLEYILERNCLDLRCDLLETGISLCSVSVPPLFSDNFDFQTLDDFVKGLLIDEEIMASTVYTYILSGSQYASFPTNWYSYNCISRDIIHRWTYPQVLDFFPNEFYSYRFGNIYIQKNASLAVGSKILDDVVVGKGCSVVAGAKISSSVIGSDCKIMSNASVVKSHLFSNICVEEGCVIENSVLGEGCVIEKNALVKNCILGPGIVVPAGKSISGLRLQTSSQDKGDEIMCGNAYEYRSSHLEEADLDSEDEGFDCDDWIGLEMTENIYDENVDDDDSALSSGDEDIGSAVSSAPDDTNLFLSEVVDSLSRGFEDKLPCDNLVLEVNSSRYAYNVSLREVNYNVARAVFSLQHIDSWEQLKQTVMHFLPLLTNYIKDTDAMSDCLFAIEDVGESNDLVKSLTVKVLHLLYEKDLLTEEAILEWHSSPREESSYSVTIRKQVSPFIKWLEEADEQSDSSDD